MSYVISRETARHINADFDPETNQYLNRINIEKFKSDLFYKHISNFPSLINQKVQDQYFLQLEKPETPASSILGPFYARSSYISVEKVTIDLNLNPYEASQLKSKGYKIFQSINSVPPNTFPDSNDIALLIANLQEHHSDIKETDRFYSGETDFQFRIKHLCQKGLHRARFQGMGLYLTLPDHMLFIENLSTGSRLKKTEELIIESGKPLLLFPGNINIKYFLDYFKHIKIKEVDLKQYDPNIQDVVFVELFGSKFTIQIPSLYEVVEIKYKKQRINSKPRKLPNPRSITKHPSKADQKYLNELIHAMFMPYHSYDKTYNPNYFNIFSIIVEYFYKNYKHSRWSEGYDIKKYMSRDTVSSYNKYYKFYIYSILNNNKKINEAQLLEDLTTIVKVIKNNYYFYYRTIKTNHTKTPLYIFRLFYIARLDAMMNHRRVLNVYEFIYHILLTYSFRKYTLRFIKTLSNQNKYSKEFKKQLQQLEHKLKVLKVRNPEIVQEYLDHYSYLPRWKELNKS